MEIMRRLVQEEEGQGMVEYALIIALISVLIIGAAALIGPGITNIFTDIATKLTNAI